MTRLQADLLLLFGAAIWGYAFVFQKTAMEHVGPFAFIAARSVVAALALAPLAWRETRAAGGVVPSGLLRIGVYAGAAFFAGAGLQQVGLVTATVTNTGFLTALYVVLVPFLAWGWYRRRPTQLVWISAGLSFVGIWLLGGGTIAALTRGDILVAICAIFWAIHMLIVGEATTHARPFLFTWWQFCVVAVCALAGTLMMETTTLAGLKAAWVEIAYVGLLSSALTFTILSIALRYAPPAEAAIIMSTENLFAALAAAIVLGERLGWINWSGAILIMIAALLVQLAPYLTARRSRVPS
jgi:drug/metabolite transporter (DMT)-like permease